ncbi:MAG: hypothetical protein FJ302_11310 [Planctomycetes bacterium]|nr:hypothetical protein [Planctomycetota bacterium]
MPLTVAEKEHWKERISRRIDKKIAAITARDPGLFDRLGSEARQRAIQSLGVSELMAEQEQLEQQKKALETRDGVVCRLLLARLRGVPAETIDMYSMCRSETEIGNAIKSRQAVHEDELMREHELGRQIVQLRLERENLLDTVFLATSPIQVRVLWEKVSDLLGDELSQLQRAALQIQPPVE